MALPVTAAFALHASSPTISAIPGGDRVQLVAVEQMPVPLPNDALKNTQSSSVAKAEDGFSSIEKSPETVRRFFNSLEIVKSQIAGQSQPEMMKLEAGRLRAPVVFKNMSDLKLSFTAATIRKGELIGAAPQGTMIGDAWTGVESFYRIEGQGYMRLSETDMKATGGMFYMIKDAVNTTVLGKPAISKIFTVDGQTVQEILWVNGSKLYTLTFVPDMEDGGLGKFKVNSRISAKSLAQEIR
ncbi:MAG: hypothetical protein V4754_15030 [Pseudomonadota bacterium]